MQSAYARQFNWQVAGPLKTGRNGARIKSPPPQIVSMLFIMK